jgi:hypothetical protein
LSSSRLKLVGRVINSWLNVRMRFVVWSPNSLIRMSIAVSYPSSAISKPAMKSYAFSSSWDSSILNFSILFKDAFSCTRTRNISQNCCHSSEEPFAVEMFAHIYLRLLIQRWSWKPNRGGLLIVQCMNHMIKLFLVIV